MTIPVNYDAYRPKACAFFAGRVWYSGLPNGEKLGWVLFSQVLDDIGNVEKCYQRNDPTSETFSDLLDSDGGVIQIPDAGEIVALIPIGRALFVLGANGVWQIIGGDTGFTAASYSVEKISSVGCLFQKSAVTVENLIFYWSVSGIYALQVDASAMSAVVQNISDQTIKEFYQDIPTINKLYVDGKYNESEKIIHWLYNKDAIDDTGEGRFKKNAVLALNLRLGRSFYTYTFSNTVSPIVTSLAVTKETVQNDLQFDVVVGSDDVDSGSDDVVTDIPVIGGSIKQFKYLTLTPVSTTYSTTFSDTLGSRFADWYKYNNVGNEVDAYVLTGYNMGGVGPARQKTVSHISMFMKRTETGFDGEAQPINAGSVLMQTKWDFTDNSNPGKWSDLYEVYRQPRVFYAEPNAAFDDGYPLVISKNKIRGRGKALQIKFQSSPGKDMSIVGWSINFVGNTNV
jgi:hypothetical protein